MEKIDWEITVKRMSKWQWAVTAMFPAVGIGIWLIFFKNLPPLVPVFYSRPWGQEQLASPYWLYLPLTAAVIITVLINLAVRSIKFDRVLAAMLLAAGIISQLILLTGVFRIIMLVV